MNISISKLSGPVLLADLFQLIGQPTRIQILLAIGESEACVCHLEAVTGLRQAVISQHLMLLRRAGLVTPNRAGRNIYYRLSKPGLLDLIRIAACSLSISELELDHFSKGSYPDCPCPKCTSSGRCHTST
jgi:DNA-binding transcriptional ArsR family regulator